MIVMVVAVVVMMMLMMVAVEVIIGKLQKLSKTFLGRVYIYMGKREFVSIDGVIEPIKGVVHIQVLRKYNQTYHCPTATAVLYNF